MSTSGPSSPSSSPASLVRSSEEPARKENVTDSPPSTGPSQITSSVLARQDGARTASERENEPRTIETHNLPAALPVTLLHDEDYDGSNANTPRLPPTLNGKSDLDNVPTDSGSFLDSPEQVTHASLVTPSVPDNDAVPNLQDTLQTSLPTSVSPPGACIHNRARSAQELRGSPQDQDGATEPAVAGSTSPPDPPRIPRAQQPPRPRSHDVGQTLSMSGIGSPEEKIHGGFDRNALAGARHEAFSEERKRSSSRSGSGRVDRQIEATMNDAEPSSNARSRKSSHVLGLFRENTSPQDGQKASRKSKRASSDFTEETLHKRTKELEHSSRGQSEPYVARSDEGSGANDRKPGSEASPLLSQESLTPLEDQRVIKAGQQPSTATSTSALDYNMAEEPQSRKSEQRSWSSGPTEGNEEAPTITAELPAKLLEQIRNYHNLAAPFHDKFRSTQLRVPGLEIESAEIEQPAKTQDVLLGNESIQKLDELNKSSPSPTDEDEDSDKEQISSALYYPHQVPSPEALQDVSIVDARKAREAEDLEPRLPEPAIPPSDTAGEPPGDVDITLQSHNKSKHLHGDLQKARPASGAEADYSQFIEGGTSSASESEYESAEENIHPSLREDSSLTDDPDATPKASPTTRKSYLESRYRKSHRKPKAPVGAVELKPYNHQVGGHSRVFRFSKRAVCKELSNRENVFYEVIEHQHPELLKFLPR